MLANVNGALRQPTPSLLDIFNKRRLRCGLRPWLGCLLLKLSQFTFATGLRGWLRPLRETRVRDVISSLSGDLRLLATHQFLHVAWAPVIGRQRIHHIATVRIEHLFKIASASLNLQRWIALQLLRS
ncbi:Uncharacterised protein [Klebsiella pneumoniae]|uniref:Uncharacterized protein n=1 Tax=Klebsiella pneumoniae TaxID=573 RepID=A0A377XA24_KLEPN|nr:Uncharacterised protein [Klebsiella pneumoniae]